MGLKIGRYELPEYSVLMSVYDQELPENLNESLESMLMQSYPPSDFVLVCDGKLTNELNIIAKSFQNEFKTIFRIIQIDENVGVGKAYNIGIEACKCDYIVKMDSDDISMPNRCLKQMALFAIQPELDIVGTFVEEFNNDTDETVSVKKVPILQDEIVTYARRRNPFNRQTLAIRKEKAVSIGGYSDMKLCEDYEFSARMLRNGAIGQNIPEVLVRYRINENTVDIRKSWKHTKAFIRVRWIIFRAGDTSFRDFLIPCMTQLALFILPRRFTAWFYRKFLRHSDQKKQEKNENSYQSAKKPKKA